MAPLGKVRGRMTMKVPWQIKGVPSQNMKIGEQRYMYKMICFEIPPRKIISHDQ